MRTRIVVSSVVAAVVLAMSLIAVPPHADAAYRGMKGTIAFVRDYEIWTMNADGSDQRQLTFTRNPSFFRRASEPAWSPDGTKIAFTRHTRWGSDVWVVDRSGQNLTRLTPKDPTPERRRYESSPTWSPDGRWLAIRRYVTDQFGNARPLMAGIFLISSTDPFGHPVRVTHGWHFAPDWSPDGSTIAFTRRESVGDGPSWFLTLVSPDGSNLRSPMLVGDEPDWSPDGDEIAYTDWSWDDDYYAYTDGSIYLQDAGFTSDAEPLVVVDETFESYGDPEWSPNGKLVAFVSNVNISYDNDLYVMATNGKQGPVKIAEDVTEPSWSPT